MKSSQKAAVLLNNIVDKGFLLCIIMVVLYASWGLYDTIKILLGTRNEDIQIYKPTITETGENPTLQDFQKINHDVV